MEGKFNVPSLPLENLSEDFRLAQHYCVNKESLRADTFVLYFALHPAPQLV
jgi:hypothetical protein